MIRPICRRQYEGGSIALPLALAILSEYFGRPVPNDVALTGAFGASAAEEGRILPVDGIPEKVEYAVQAGSRLIYVPSANAPEVDNRPALRNQVAEHGARVVSVETLGEVCQDLFPAEGSGRLKDVLKDALVPRPRSWGWKYLLSPPPLADLVGNGPARRWPCEGERRL